MLTRIGKSLKECVFFCAVSERTRCLLYQLPSKGPLPLTARPVVPTGNLLLFSSRATFQNNLEGLPFMRSRSAEETAVRPEESEPGEATVAVHGGKRAIQPFGAVVPPVFHSSTYAFATFDQMRRYARGELGHSYFYSRYANPTVAAVEQTIAKLEGAEACVVTSSGSAATFCALAALCEAGDEIIACDSVYGGSVKTISKLLSR